MAEEAKFDAKSRALVAALEEDGRASFAQLGRTIRTSKEVVAYRYDRLKEKGILQEMQPIINYFSLGYTCYSLLINLYRLEHDTKEKILEYLKKIPRLYARLFVQSRYDIDVMFWASSENEFRDFFREFTGVFANFIRHKELFVITEMHIFSYQYLHEQNHAWHLYGKDTRTIDNIDEKLLEQLREDGRQDLITLGKATETPVSTIRYHLSKLTKEKIIAGYRPMLDISKLGYSKYRIAVDLSDPTQATPAATYLGIQANVVRVVETIGRFDIFFDIHVKTVRELDVFMQKFRQFIPEVWDVDVMLIKQ